MDMDLEEASVSWIMAENLMIVVRTLTLSVLLFVVASVRLSACV